MCISCFSRRLTTQSVVCNVWNSLGVLWYFMCFDVSWGPIGRPETLKILVTSLVFHASWDVSRPAWPPRNLENPCEFVGVSCVLRCLEACVAAQKPWKFWDAPRGFLIDFSLDSLKKYNQQYVRLVHIVFDLTRSAEKYYFRNIIAPPKAPNHRWWQKKGP